MPKSRHTVAVTLVLAWAAFALWQYRGWRHQQFLVHESVRQQSHSVMSALIGAIQSHRRLGRFFDTQLRGLLDGMAQAEDVLAVAVNSQDGQWTVSAGDAKLLSPRELASPGDRWDRAGFVLVDRFEVTPLEDPPPGRGRRRMLEDGPDSQQWAAEGTFWATLVLDRTRADALLRNAGWSHGIATVAGALVVIGLAWIWNTTVRLVEERGRSELLNSEARHYRELSQAAAGLAHETRNPLGLVRGWTERLVHDDVDAARKQLHAQAVMEECDRITARINQFLAFARPCEPDIVDVDLRDLASELRMILQPDCETKEVRLILESLPEGATVRADRELLRQALFNLVQNAIQFSSPASEVQLEWVVERDSTGRLEVCDRGSGVKLDDIESLFSPYFTTRTGGTGLGLAIVRRIAFAHHWRATYRPRPGGGAIFSLEGLQLGRQNDSGCRR